jgi:hypothetical protein
MRLNTARLKSCSEKVDALRRDTISSNLGCLHVPGEGGGTGEGIGVDSTRGVDGRGISAFIVKHILGTVVDLMTLDRLRYRGWAICMQVAERYLNSTRLLVVS